MLGSSADLWEGIERRLSERIEGLAGKWAFAGRSFGWSYRLLLGERRILYLIPARGFFLAGIVLGGRAASSPVGDSLPEDIRKALDNAPVHAEGRGLRFEVRTARDAGAVEILVAMKLSPE